MALDLAKPSLPACSFVELLRSMSWFPYASLALVESGTMYETHCSSSAPGLQPSQSTHVSLLCIAHMQSSSLSP